MSCLGPQGLVSFDSVALCSVSGVGNYGTVVQDGHPAKL